MMGIALNIPAMPRARRVRMGWGVLLLCVGWTAGVQAQTPAVCNPLRVEVNRQGATQPMVVGATAVTVLSENLAACQRLIRNVGTAPMNCLPLAQGAPTATAGWTFVPGGELELGLEGREQWRCIRTTATDTSAITLEAIQ
jgi:hypothetical protein